jgi:serine/threonine protein kinase
LVEEIRQLKAHFEDLILSPSSTAQQAIMISSLNDSLITAIGESSEAMQSQLGQLAQPLQRIQSDSDKILQLARFNLISEKSQQWRREQLEKVTIPLESIRLTSIKIGEGGFAKVFLGSCPSKPLIAVKQIGHNHRPSELQAVENEVLLMDCCTSDHFLEIYGFAHCKGVGASPCYSLICMQYAAAGALSQFLVDFQPPPVSLLLVFLSDIISALAYLHQRRIIHRDVKTDNVLLTSDLKCLLTDFGFAKEQLSSTLGTHSKVAGAVAFLAPEVMTRGGCTHRSDIYSFGVLCSHVLSGSIPDSRAHISQSIDLAIASVPSSIVPLLRPLLELCLSTNPSDRPSAHEIRPKLKEIGKILGDPRQRLTNHADSSFVTDCKAAMELKHADHMREIEAESVLSSEVATRPTSCSC